MFRPRSSSNTVRPRSVSSFAAQPPEMPEPITMASYVVSVMRASDGTDRDCFFERTERILGRHELVSEVPGKASLGQRGCHGVVVELLGLVDLVTTGDAASMEVAEVGQIVADGSDHVAFHDLHVVDVVEQLDGR